MTATSATPAISAAPLLRCKGCGYRSANHKFFRREPSGLLSRQAWFCMLCRPYRATKIEGASVAVPVLFLVSGFGLTILGGHSMFSGIGHLFLLIAAVNCSRLVTITVHELGHAAANWLAGLRTTVIAIGAGPVLTQFKLQGAQVIIGRFLFVNGFTMGDWHQTRSRWQKLLSISGGLLANAVFAIVIAVLMAYLIPTGYRGWLLPGIGLALIISQLLCIVTNLFPRRSRGNGIVELTDGALLLALLRNRKLEQSERDLVDIWRSTHGLFKSNRMTEACQLLEAACDKYPANAALLSNLIHAVNRTQGPRTAMRVFRQRRGLLDETDVAGRPNVAWAYGKAAAIAVMTGDSTDFQEADSLSNFAITELPDSPEIRATRGASLAYSGDPAGHAMLIQGTRDVANPDNKLEFAKILSDLSRAEGNHGMAEECAAAGRHLAAELERRRA